MIKYFQQKFLFGGRKEEAFQARDFPSKRRRREKESSTDWRWIVGILAVTVFLSLAFWAWGEMSIQEGKENELESTETVLEGERPASSFGRDNQEIEGEIREITGDLQGTYGVYVYNLAGKWEYGVNQDRVFTAASLIKLPVFLALYQEVESGKISLDQEYILKKEDKQAGAGSLQYRSPGAVYTYKQMASLMGEQSDNTAFSVFRKSLGEKKIQKAIDEMGMEKTSFKENTTTPKDVGLFFRRLYGGGVLTREHRDEILSFLTETAFETRIPVGVPGGVRVAHKIGNEVGVFSDAGIVFAQKPFVLVIMSQEALEREAKKALVEITRVVWEFEN